MKFTVSAKDRVRFGVTDKTQAVLQSAALLLATRRGTVPLFRDFGIPWDALDRPVQIGKAMLFAQIREAFLEFVPDAELAGLSFLDDPDDPGHTFPVAEVNILP